MPRITLKCILSDERELRIRETYRERAQSCSLMILGDARGAPSSSLGGRHLSILPLSFSNVKGRQVIRSDEIRFILRVRNRITQNFYVCETSFDFFVFLYRR